MTTSWVFLLAALQLLAQAAAYDNNFNLDLSKRYVDFCGAAYCTDPLVKKNSVDNWSCSACKAYPNVQAQSFHGNRSDANGFVAYDADANEIIVSFSGTDPLSIQNWIDDLDFVKTAYPYCSGCEVHEGFYKSFLSVSDTVKSLVQSYQAAHSSAKIAVTGHSLGAAMAAHCAAELVHSGFSIETVYSYGMPRVGNEAFEKWYVTVVPGTFRCVHKKDPVPQLPPKNWGFHHMPYEVFYLQDYTNWRLCNAEGEDISCSDQYIAALNVQDHLQYMGMDFTTNYLSCQL
eukprot:gene10167-11251_t